MTETQRTEASAHTPCTHTLVVDDHALYRLGLRHALAPFHEIDIVGDAGDGGAALALLAHVHVDVALVDLHMPMIDGVALARSMRSKNPRCKVLMLSASEEPYAIAQALDAGAAGFVFKTQDTAQIADAIRTVDAGLRYLPPNAHYEPAALDVVQAIARLSAREREVLHLLVDGRSNDDIAGALFISRRTVETHRQRIMKKLGVHTIAHLVHVAMRLGLVS